MHITKQHILIYTSFVILLATAAVGGYYYGLQKQSQEVQNLKDEQLSQNASYANSINVVQNERDRALNDYQTACMEYQILRTAYTQLYDKTGVASGQSKYSSPDDARGNEESCYR